MQPCCISEVVPLITLGRVIDEVVASKTAANRRPTYIRALRAYLKMFSRGRECMAIGDVTRATLVSWFSSRQESPVSRRTGIQLLRVLFSFAQRCGYIESNPALLIEKVSVDLKPPQIFTPSEVRKILLYCKRHMRWRLPQVILGLYSGIRPHELSRLYWRDVDLERGFVRIDAAAAKTRRRRIIQLDGKSIAWLRWCRRKGVNEDRPIGSLCWKWKRLLVRNCGIEWRQDCFRHCAASYMLARVGDAGKVARFLGNSEAVLVTRYMQLVDPSDSRRYWWVWPSMRPK